MAVKRRSVAPKSNTITALEMAKRGQYKTYNLVDPEHGMKHYDPIDPNMQENCLYRSARMAVNKLDKPDHFTDKHALQFKHVPAAKYEVLRDWSKAEMFASSVGRLRNRFKPEGKGIK
jgi:hypothetical protein